MLQNNTIGFIGGGNMAEALIRGLLAGGLPASRIRVTEPLAARRDYLLEMYGVEAGTSNRLLAKGCDVAILAVKPQIAPALLTELAEVLPKTTLLVSIMAGITCAAIESAFIRPVRLVRVMPNTPALVLAGASALCRGSHAADGDLALAEAIFAQVGTTCRVEERLMDAVTGLSGSGPAYVLTFIEALADGGVKNGLTRETALALAAQTVLGTAKLLLAGSEHPASLRDKVTSPGGTTIAGLHALEKGSFRATVMGTVDAATRRAEELGRK
jgi:pyrroline-5-carboxylate reductase